MQRMVPGEAHAARHLDRALACRDRGLRGIRLRRNRGKLGLTVILGDAPRGPVRERARELGLDVGVRELVRDRLVRAYRPAELLAALRVLYPKGERMAGDAGGLEGERGQRAPPSGRDDPGGGGRRREEAGVVVLEGDAAETTSRVDRVEDADLRPGAMALCEVQPDAVRPTRLDYERVDTARVGNEVRLTSQAPAIARPACLHRRPGRERRGELARGDLCQEIRSASEGRQRERDRREVRTRIERAAKLLEHDRLFDEAQAGTTLRLGDRRAGPSETGQLWPGRAVPAILGRRDLREAREGVTPLEERASLRAELVLLRREAEVHQRLRGRPRTRSAMMFRKISDVPASMVLPRLRSC